MTHRYHCRQFRYVRIHFVSSSFLYLAVVLPIIWLKRLNTDNYILWFNPFTHFLLSSDDRTDLASSACSSVMSLELSLNTNKTKENLHKTGFLTYQRVVYVYKTQISFDLLRFLFPIQLTGKRVSFSCYFCDNDDACDDGDDNVFYCFEIPRHLGRRHPFGRCCNFLLVSVARPRPVPALLQGFRSKDS